jgi:hypothetical protein
MEIASAAMTFTPGQCRSLSLRDDKFRYIKYLFWSLRGYVHAPILVALSGHGIWAPGD